MLASPAERNQAKERAEEAIEQCQLSSIAHRPAGDLSTGQRRLTELARTMASPFRFLLLDEPSSGLDEVETGNFGSILLDVIDRRDIGILLVEHDMSLVRAVCSYTYVLEFGKQIFEGPTSDVLSNDAVRAAYLGREAADEPQGVH
jgi:ABC-type branched-subunit amino acid transport system ATPase component